MNTGQPTCVGCSSAYLIAIGIDWDGRRQVLGVELANRETRSSWRDFLTGLRERGLHGVEFVVADDHARVKASIRKVLPEAAYQRCYVHFLRNALDYVPRKSLPTGLTRGWMTTACKSCAGWEPALGPAFGRTRGTAATSPRRADLAACIPKWQAKYVRLVAWVEDNIEETLTFYRLPRQHHKHLKSTLMIGGFAAFRTVSLHHRTALK